MYSVVLWMMGRYQLCIHIEYTMYFYLCLSVISYINNKRGYTKSSMSLRIENRRQSVIRGTLFYSVTIACTLTYYI